MKETITPLVGETQLESAATEQARLEHNENQTAAPETPATPDGHKEEPLCEDLPVGNSEQEFHGENEATPQENPGDVDQNGQDEKSSQDDTPGAPNEEAGQGDDGASHDPLGLSDTETEELEREVVRISSMSLEELTSEIKNMRKLASEDAEEVMMSCSRRNVIYAFKIGNLLVQAKSVHRAANTKYLDWLNEEFVKPEVMSVRTAQRYVQLVKRCDEPEKLVKEAHGLRDIYQKAGIIRPFDVKETSGQGGEKNKRSDMESLMKGLLDTQKTLRNLVQKVCVEVESEPDKDQRVQIVACRDEINGFVGKINGFISKLLGETDGETDPGDAEPETDQNAGNTGEEDANEPPLNPPDPGVIAKSKGGRTTHVAMGQAEPGSKKPASGKSKSGKSQTPATASK